ncbi:MAG: tetratricopeptide repeat protein [Methanosarcinaceae archaeon]|nr:tetratricopeptide repeat protein [Methanosarcinaceae archaeon]
MTRKKKLGKESPIPPKWDPPAPSTVYIKLKNIPYGTFKARLNQGLITTELDQIGWRLKQHIYCCGVCQKYFNEYCVTENRKVGPEDICKSFIPKQEFRNLQARPFFGKDRSLKYLSEGAKSISLSGAGKTGSVDKESEESKTTEEYYDEGLMLYKQGRLRLALEIFDRILEKAPKYFEARFYRGSSLLKLTRYEEALEAFEKALEIRPDNAVAWTNRGLVLLKLERFRAALDSFEKAISLNPGQKKARDGKEVALKYIRRSEAALEKYEQALQKNPVDAAAWFGKGSLHLKLGEREKAGEALEKATATKSDLPEAWYFRGRLLLELGSGKEALHAFERAIRTKPDYAGAWYEKGNAFLKLENEKGAMNAYGIAADLWKKKGELRKAESAFEKLRKIRER